MKKLHIIQKIMLKNWSKYTKEFINWMSWMTTFNIELISRHLKKQLIEINEEVDF